MNFRKLNLSAGRGVRLACTVLLLAGLSILGVDAATSVLVTTGGVTLEGEHGLTIEDLKAGRDAVVSKLARSLKPGMLLGFCEEDETGILRGPFYSNTVEVAVATAFEVNLATIEVERDTVEVGAHHDITSEGVKTESSASGILTGFDRAGIQQITTVDQIIAQLAGLDEPIQISIRDIYQLLLENGLIAADINVEDFFLVLADYGFLAQEDVAGIFEQLTAQGIFLSERVDGIFEALERLGIFVNTMTSKLFSVLEKLGIELALTSTLFQSLLSHLGTALELTSSELDDLLQKLNIAVGLSSEKLSDILTQVMHAMNLESTRYDEGIETKGVEVSMTLHCAELGLWQNVQRTRAGPGDRLEYEIYVGNSGTVHAERSVIVLVLPEGIALEKKSVKGEKSSVIKLDDGRTCITWEAKKKLKAGGKSKRLRYRATVDFQGSVRRR